MVKGMVEAGDLDNKRQTDEPTSRWTIIPLKHAPSGNALRVEMDFLGQTALPVEMAPREETLQEEAMRQRATIAGSQAIPDPIVLTRSK